MQRSRLAAALLVLALGTTSLAARATDCMPVVRDGWVRIPPTGLPMAAGFGLFDNACDGDATIVSVSSPAFEDTTVHATTIQDGISRMRAVPELRVAARSVATFEPGGLHLMLMRPTAALAPGDTIPVEFTLSDGRVVRAEFVARGM